MEKKNCWEHKKCGRGLGPKDAGIKERCPAATEKRLDGVHNGRNAGRACWVIASTLCQGKVQKSFGYKFGECAKCDFYRLVRDEEGADFIMSVRLLKMLKQK